MQADRRLVQHVEHAAQLRADLRRQPDALRFSARQRGRRTVQAQIMQPDGGKKLQPAADLIEHAAGDLHLALGELPDRAVSSAREIGMAVNSAMETSFHPHRQARRPQPLAMTSRARDGRHVFRQPLAITLRRFLESSACRILRMPGKPLPPSSSSVCVFFGKSSNGVESLIFKIRDASLSQ